MHVIFMELIPSANLMQKTKKQNKTKQIKTKTKDKPEQTKNNQIIIRLKSWVANILNNTITPGFV